MKRLVICCDGTWQRLYGEHLTNVALTARAVASRDAKGQPQIVYYSAGVGASLSGLSLALHQSELRARRSALPVRVFTRRLYGAEFGRVVA